MNYYNYLQDNFINICNNYPDYKLNSCYIPTTIITFISELMIDNEKNIAIYPFCKTGDLLLQYKSKKYLFDDDNNILKLCKLNYILYNNNNHIIECKNILNDYTNYISLATYTLINTSITSYENAITLIELGIKILKNNGILFIFIPSDYVIKIKYKIIAIIEFPKNIFNRPDIYDNTKLLIIQNNIEKDYEIFISKIENIGYNLTKDDRPKEYIMDINTNSYINYKGINVLNNDLELTYTQISYFCRKNNIKNINYIDYNYVIDYDKILSNEL